LICDFEDSAQTIRSHGRAAFRFDLCPKRCHWHSFSSELSISRFKAFLIIGRTTQIMPFYKLKIVCSSTEAQINPTCRSSIQNQMFGKASRCVRPLSNCQAHSSQLPGQYLANNWPVLQASISSDGRLIAVAGAYGLCHYNSLSGRWKMFDRPQDEQSFAVRGGMQWYENVLLVALETMDKRQFKVSASFQDRQA
jgi:hypothetical protein